MKVDGLLAFDEMFQTKIYKQYPTVESYYKDTSCNLKLSEIMVPTLFITAKDDDLNHISEESIEKCINNYLIIYNIIK